MCTRASTALSACRTASQRSAGHSATRTPEGGVSALLAEFDKLNRRQKVLTEILEGQAADMIGIEELKNIPGDYVADGDNYDRRRPQLRVRMLEREDLQGLQQVLRRARPGLRPGRRDRRPQQGNAFAGTGRGGGPRRRPLKEFVPSASGDDPGCRAVRHPGD